MRLLTASRTYTARIESLRQADLSGATSPRAFGGVLLARFDVKADAFEQKELVALLRDEVSTRFVYCRNSIGALGSSFEGGRII